MPFAKAVSALLFPFARTRDRVKVRPLIGLDLKDPRPCLKGRLLALRALRAVASSVILVRASCHSGLHRLPRHLAASSRQIFHLDDGIHGTVGARYRHCRRARFPALLGTGRSVVRRTRGSLSGRECSTAALPSAFQSVSVRRSPGRWVTLNAPDTSNSHRWPCWSTAEKLTSTPTREGDLLTDLAEPALGQTLRAFSCALRPSRTDRAWKVFVRRGMAPLADTVEAEVVWLSILIRILEQPRLAVCVRRFPPPGTRAFEAALPFLGDALFGQLDVAVIGIETDVMAAGADRRDGRRSRAHEGIEHQDHPAHRCRGRSVALAEPPGTVLDVPPG